MWIAHTATHRTRYRATSHGDAMATRLYHKTGDLHLVQRALGHRQITTTEVYARVNDEHLRKAVAGV